MKGILRQTYGTGMTGNRARQDGPSGPPCAPPKVDAQVHVHRQPWGLGPSRHLQDRYGTHAEGGSSQQNASASTSLTNQHARSWVHALAAAPYGKNQGGATGHVRASTGAAGGSTNTEPPAWQSQQDASYLKATDGPSSGWAARPNANRWNDNPPSPWPTDFSGFNWQEHLAFAKRVSDMLQEWRTNDGAAREASDRRQRARASAGFATQTPRAWLGRVRQAAKAATRRVKAWVHELWRRTLTLLWLPIVALRRLVSAQGSNAAHE